MITTKIEAMKKRLEQALHEAEGAVSDLRDFVYVETVIPEKGLEDVIEQLDTAMKIVLQVRIRPDGGVVVSKETGIRYESLMEDEE